jgi:RNA polymerase sigma-70 factor (ECF subfamily)
VTNGAARLAAAHDVVRRAQQGDVEAFASLYRAHGPAVFSLVRRMLGDERAARDLVQDVFVRAWERLASFRGDSAFGTWLHRLAANLVVETLRAARRDVLRFTDDAADTTPATRSDTDAIDARLDLDAALVGLAAGARAVFVLHDLEGYSHEEIAQMTGIAAGTARAQLWRARRHLMKRLDP